jgi:hypothetical protein
VVNGDGVWLAVMSAVRKWLDTRAFHNVGELIFMVASSGWMRGGHREVEDCTVRGYSWLL